MPQLDLSTYPSQLFWLCLFFGVLWGVMQFIIVPPMKKTLKKRQTYILSLVKEAKVTQDEAEQRLEKARSDLAHAQAELREEIQREHSKAQDILLEKKDALHQKFQTELHREMARLEEERCALMQDKKRIEQLAKELLKKVHQAYVKGK
jgi:F-type H+-transporting ATPase subunit b